METMSTFADFLKIFYIANIRKLLNTSSYFYFRMEKNSDDIVGKNATVALQRGLLPTGSRDENDTAGLPAPGTLPKEQAIIPLAFHYVRIQFSGIIEAASAKDIGAFISVVTSQSKAAQDSLKLALNIQCVKAHEGLISTAAGAETAGTYTAAAPGALTVDTSQWMYPGMRIGVLDESNSWAELSTGGLIIESILSSTTISFSGILATDIASSDKIYIYGNKNKQMYGLDNIFNTTGTDTYLGVDRGVVAEWKANLLGNGTVDRDLTLNLMQQAVDEPAAKAMGEVTAIHCRNATRRAYVDHLIADRRYNYPDTLKLDGGFTGLEYSGGDKPIPVVAERHMTPGTMYFLDESTFTLYRMGDGANWVPGPINGIFHSMVTAATSSDSVMAALRSYENLACTNPRKSTMLYDLNEK